MDGEVLATLAEPKTVSDCIWPKWSGDVVAIVASGPSAKSTPVDLLRGRARIIAIKESINLCPWADAVYGCDGPWWHHCQGLPEFNGLKLAWDAAACKKYGLRKVDVEKLTDRLLFDRIGLVGAGGNSGFQALNLAAQFGASRIVLVGFDMHDRSGAHWYGRNNWNAANNPSEENFRRWKSAFTQSADDLVEREIDVVNVSPISVLECFRRSSIEEVLKEWT